MLPKLVTLFLLPSVDISRLSAHLFTPQYLLSLLITYSQSAFRKMFTEEPRSEFCISAN